MLTLHLEAVNIVDQEYQTFTKELDELVTYEYEVNFNDKNFITVFFDDLVEDNNHIYHITADLYLKLSGQPKRLIASTNSYKSDNFIVTYYTRGNNQVEFRIPINSSIPIPLIAHKWNRMNERNHRIKKMVRGERQRSSSDLETYLCKQMIFS